MIKAIYAATPFCSPGIIDGRYIINTNQAADNSDGVVLPFVGESPMTYYAYQPGAFHTNNNKLSMDLVLDQKLDMITKGLSVKLKGSYNSSFLVQKTLTASVASYTPVWTWNDESKTDGYLMYRKSGSDVEPTYSYGYGKGRDWYAEGSLNYNRSFGDHTITALALYNQSKQYYFGDEEAYKDIPRTYVGFVGRVT